MDKKSWSKQRGFKSYGSTALGKGFQVGGIEEYLKKIEEKGKSIDDAVKEAIEESIKPILEDMKEGALRHKDSGEVYEAIEATPVVQEGNYIYARVGIDLKKHPKAIHAVFQEYGDSHSEKFPDPFARLAFDNNIKVVKKAQKDVLYRHGIL